MKIVKSLLVIFLLFVGIIPAAAQDAVLEYGVPVNGEISNDKILYRYTFEGGAGDTIYISAFIPGDSFPAVLRLLAPNGAQLAQVNRNALGTVLPPTKLEAAGSYTVELIREEWAVDQSGSFQLVVDRTSPTAIKPDGVYTGRLEYPGDIAFFTYSAPQNEFFSYNINGEALIFFMLDPNRSLFINTNVADEIYEPLSALPSEGEYIAMLQTLHEDGSDYTLSLKPVTPIVMQPGDTLTGEYSELDSPVFVFDSTANASWNIISHVATDLDSQLLVYDASQPYYTIDGDYGGSDGSPRVDSFLAPADGQYLVVLRSFDNQPGNRELAYTVSLEAVELKLLTLDTLVQGTLKSDTGEVTYFYDGQEGETLRISIELISDAGELGLQMYSPQDEVINFGARGGTKATFEVTLRVTGLHRVIVRDNSYQAPKMDYSLSIEAVE